MVKIKIIVNCILLAILTTSAFAKSFDPCAGGSVFENTECAQREFKQVDARLNAIYKEIIQGLSTSKERESPTIREALMKAQKAWVAYKEAQCTLEGRLEGGLPSWKGYFQVDCQNNMTKERIDYLRNTFSDYLKNP